MADESSVYTWVAGIELWPGYWAGTASSFTNLAIALASNCPLVGINKALLALPSSLLCGILNLKLEQLGCLLSPFTWYFKL